ncbi:MAG: Ig-like domain-containing protein [Cyclobacteriaceae bacterium]|nr:Ig-like domain-containing protein [Cyclobacteriaceae bacterium HetDA_MAG_MS6]
MKKRIQKLLFVALGTLPVIALVLYQNNQTNKRETYRKFISEHPYSQQKLTSADIDAIPKYDRPDLAAQQNFLMTADPNTHQIPAGALWDAYQYTRKQLKASGYSYSSPKSGALQVPYSSPSSDPFSGGTLFPSYEDAQKGSRSYAGGPDLNVNMKISTDGDNAIAQFDAIPGVVWKERGPDNIGGRTRALMFDPNDTTVKKVWAGGVSGGIWYNNDITDPNSSWQTVDDFLANLAITSITYDPTNTMVFYAATGEGYFNADAVRGSGIFKSTDGGTSWDLLASTVENDSFSYVQKVVVTGQGTVIATTRDATANVDLGGVFRSTDDGATWTRVLTARGADIEIAANGDIYVSRGLFSPGTVSRSVDDGVNWTDVTPPGGEPERIELAVAQSVSSTTATTVIYALASDNTAVEWFQKSTDGGATWTSLTIPEYREQNCSTNGRDFARGQAWYDLIIEVSPIDPDVLLMGGINVLKSSDGGVNTAEISYWTGGCDTYVHADIHNIVFRPGFPAQVIVGSDGGVSYSTDAGVLSDPEFENRNKNYSVTQFYAVAADNVAGSGYFLAGSQDNGTQQFTDANGASTEEATGGDGAFCFVDQDDRDFQVTSFIFNSYRHSSNGGDSFTAITNDQNSGRFINPTDYDNVTGILYSAGNTDELKRIQSIDSSTPASQETITVDLGTGQISALRADAAQSNRVFVGTGSGNVYRIDSAHAATPVVTDITGTIDVGLISSIDIGSSDDELIVTLSNYGVKSVWYTDNGGDTWTSKDEDTYGLPNMPIRWALFNPMNTSQVLLATELGVWSTNDVKAANPGWEPTNNNLANVRCDMLQFREADSVVVVGTHGRGLFTTDIFSATTDTAGPEVLALTPADNSENVSLTQVFEIKFDEPIVAATGTVSLRRVSDDGVVEIFDSGSSSVSITGATASISFTDALPASTEFYILVDAGAFADNNGIGFAGIVSDTAWTFTTFDGDQPPSVVTPIDNFDVASGADPIIVDLTTVFDDPDNDNSAITYSVESSNSTLLTLDDVTDGELTITLAAGKIGIADITVTATSNSKMAQDQFRVLVSDGNEVVFAQPSLGNGNGQLEGNYLDEINRNTDDFVVPGGQQWTISSVTTEAFYLGSLPLNLQSVTVSIYADNEGSPGDTLHNQVVAVDQAQIIGGTATNPSLVVALNEDIILSPDTFWISIFPDFNANAFAEAGGIEALYAWFQSPNPGNSYSSDGGAYTADANEMAFGLNGTNVISDTLPEVAAPIADLFLFEDNPTLEIDLSQTFTDPDNDDSQIDIDVYEISDDTVISVSVENKIMTLTAGDKFGKATIVLRATSNGLSVFEVFDVFNEKFEKLYEQVGISAGTSPSQIFPDFGNASLEAADEFTIPAGEVWNIDKVLVDGSASQNIPEQAIVAIYADDNGSPGSFLWQSPLVDLEPTNGPANFRMTLGSPAILEEGTYWLSVLTFMSFSGGNQWFWSYATPAEGADYHIQDPGQLLGGSFPASWEASGNDGKLIFTLAGYEAPNAPTELEVEETEEGITLNWTDNSDNETEFVIERAVTGGEFEEIGSVDPNVTTFVDTDFDTNTDYTYLVIAFLNEGFSDEAEGDILTLPAIPEVDTEVIGLDSAQFDFESEDELLPFVFYLFEEDGETAVEDSVVVEADSLIVKSLSSNTIYKAVVSVSNESGSASSDTLEVLTLPAAPVIGDAVEVEYNEFTATWSTVDGAETFLLDVATDEEFANILTEFDGLEVSDTSAVVDDIGDGTYYFRVAASNETGDSEYSGTGTAEILPLGIGLEDETFEVYPNPGPGLYTIELGSTSSVRPTIAVFDVLGRKVLELNSKVSTGAISVDIRSQENGVYLIKVSRGEEEKIRRVIKE